MLLTLGGGPAQITPRGGAAKGFTLLIDEHASPEVLERSQPRNPYMANRSEVSSGLIVGIVAGGEMPPGELQDATVAAKNESFLVSFTEKNEGFWRLLLRRA